MKDIKLIKSKIQLLIAKQCCKIQDISLCKKDVCTCSLAAQTQSYIQTVIPQGYKKASIFDLNGFSQTSGKDSKRQKLVNSESISFAKRQIVQYCWGSIDINKISSISQLDQISIITKRRQQGRNVIIYSQSSTMSMQSGAVTKPRGKTFCASIIMIEAIKSRMNKGYYSQSFDWVKYPVLGQRLKKFDDDSTSNMRYADWLVIDDISKYQNKYTRTSVDPFILQRIQNGLPTIFVCRFDIDNINDEQSIGSSLAQVIHDKNTIKIKLDGNVI